MIVSMEILLSFVLLALFFYVVLNLFNINNKLGLGKKSDNASESGSLKTPLRTPWWCLALLTRGMTAYLHYVKSLNVITEQRFGTLRVIMINDFELGKEMFKNPVFCGKETDAVRFFTGSSHGIVGAEGRRWKEQRMFCNQQLKELGFGTKYMESFIQNEISDLLQLWANKNGQVFSPNKSFYTPVLNAIWAILAGDRASGDRRTLVTLILNVYEALNKYLNFPEILLVLFRIRMKTAVKIANWIPIFPGIQHMDRSNAGLRSYFQNTIAAKKKTLNLNESPRDLVDAYLLKIHKTTDDQSEFFKSQGELNLMGVMRNFFFAGGDTTANMLSWVMLHLIRNPEIQDKIHKEIQSAVGSDCRPILQADRPNCPYTEAFILEVLRVNPVASASMPHASTEDASVGEYFIKKGSMLFLNIHGIHHDPKIWGDPENFRPERFLSENGKDVLKREEMCIFSLGQRRCPGEQFSRDALFLFVAAICQRFILKPDPSLKGFPGICEVGSAINAPSKFNMVAIDRYNCSTN